VRKLLPQSLIGQIALVIAAVLLVLQGINFIVIQSERQRLTQSQLEGPVLTRFVATAGRMIERQRERPIANRRGRVSIDERPIVAAEESDEALAGRLRETALANGLELQDTRAALSDVLPPPPPLRDDDMRQQRSDVQETREERFRALNLSGRLPDGQWINGRLLILRPNAGPLYRQAGTTLLLYAVLLAAMILVLRRLIRPLRDLTGAAERFRGRGEALHVEPRGPTDVRRAIEAFNAMGSRVSSLLDEKDRMLGAIGHDLRTPLASLRIRAENVDPPDERERMIATIEEMTGMLEDTLSLARSGRSQEPPRALDVSALADAVVEEFRELGREVTMEESARAVATVRPNLVRNALRNLIDNAVKYGGSATVSVEADRDHVTLSVADRGPGIPADQIRSVMEPFVRLEGSRSRETGGSGLGITLARAAAQLHGGELELVNRPEGGLVCRLVLPCRGPAQA
jgi:signal transduction histidine kinase